MKHTKEAEAFILLAIAAQLGSQHPALGGDMPFTERVLSTTADGAHSVFATDLDGDGDTDALSASWRDHKIAWYESDGASPPTFTERVISTAADIAVSVFATDVDGDGDTDVLSASIFDGKIAWHENKIPPIATVSHWGLIAMPIVYGDVNDSGFVELDDILYVIAGFGDPVACPTADIAGREANRLIDLDDILAIIGAFGGADPCCGQP